jgi:hypothetical protein
MPDSDADYLLDAVRENWNDILYVFGEFADKKPVILFDIQEQRIYAYPYKEYKAELSPRSQALLKDQYERSLRDHTIVIFVRDNERRKLVAYSLPYES